MLEVGGTANWSWRTLEASGRSDSVAERAPTLQMFRRSTAPSVLISNPTAGADLPRRLKPTARAHTGRLIGKSLAILFTALTGILVFNVVSESGRDGRATTRGLLDADTIASLAGFGIDQVSLTGHRFTLQAELALAGKADTLPGKLRVTGYVGDSHWACPVVR